MLLGHGHGRLMVMPLQPLSSRLNRKVAGRCKPLQQACGYHALNPSGRLTLEPTRPRSSHWQRGKASQTSGAAAAAAVQATASNPASLLISAGIFLLSAALAALALAAIPAVLEWRRTARELQLLARALEQEIPDTAASMRLTGLELADAIQEVSLLSNDVTRGLHSSARMLQAAEGSMKQGAAFVQTAASTQLLPALRSQVPVARGLLAEALRKNTSLTHTEPTLLQLATATKVTAQRIRFALAAANLMGTARSVTELLSSRAGRQWDR